MRISTKTLVASILMTAATSSFAVAQGTDEPATPEGTPDSTAAPTAPASLPPSQSDNDTAPPVAAPIIPGAGGLVSQAGIGGVVGYGRAGVLELGGSAGFTFASDYRNVNVSPTIGWFIADNFEISAILSIANIKAGDAPSSTLWSALLEPSYHVPFNRSVFGFLGIGAGASHISGLGTGFAVAPRLGANFMIGRSGILTPSLSYQYTTINTDMTGTNGVTVVALTSAVQFNLGYTAMW
jgi:hypothetical protein